MDLDQRLEKYWIKFFISLWYRYIKTIIITHGDKVYSKFYGLNVPVDDIKCESSICRQLSI